MGWLRSLAAEMFPTWHERRLLQQSEADSSASINALEGFRRKLARSDILTETPSRSLYCGARRAASPATANTGEILESDKPDTSKEA